MITRPTAAWMLSEESGTATDIYAGITLTDNNTVTSNPGKVYPLARQFTAANSESLSVADNATLSLGNIPFTFAAWLYLDSKGANRVALCKGNSISGATGYEFVLFYQSSSDRLAFSVSNGTASQVATAGSAPSTGTWYLAIGRHDPAADTVSIQVNNASEVSQAFTSGSWDSTFAFRIGDDGASRLWDGRIGPAMFWKNYLLTSAEATQLYNAGTGLPFSAFAPQSPATVLLAPGFGFGF